MTCETIYAKGPSITEVGSLLSPPTLLRSSNVGLFTFSARVVMSYLKIGYERQKNPPPSALKKFRAQCFVVNTNSHVTVLNELMNGEQCVVRLRKVR